MRISGIAILVLALAFCALVAPATGDEEVYYNLTSVEDQQMSNAVQIVVRADGSMDCDMDRLEFDNCNYSRLQQNGWRYDREAGKPIEALDVTFDNARLQVNNIVPVGKFPISHLEFSPVEGSEYGVKMRVCFYTKACLSHVKSRYWDDLSVPGTDWRDCVHLDVVPGEDERSVVITAISDRAMDTPEHRTAEGLKDSDKELSISADGGGFDVHAKNVPLSDLVRELKSKSGQPVELDPSVDRLVTAELPKSSFDCIISSICECYGLTTEGSPNGAFVLRETAVQVDGSYGQQEIQTVPLRFMQAEDALDLLPNFLTRCVRIDKTNNRLVFSGSKEFANKLHSDLAIVDRPKKTVEIEATLLEIAPTVDLDAGLGLAYGNHNTMASIDLPSVQFGISASEMSPPQFGAALNALEESAQARNVNRASLKVVSGEKGTLFAGVDKYIQVRDQWEAKDDVIPVKAGLNLEIKPIVTGTHVQVDLSVEVSNINVIDPVTKLPVVDSRKASGFFRLEPGQSIVVGGLDSLQTSVERRRLPVLGYLPIIGSLFTRTIRHHEHSRLMLILTPRIVEESDAIHNL